jgi:signal transduction histidine kinase
VLLILLFTLSCKKKNDNNSTHNKVMVNVNRMESLTTLQKIHYLDSIAAILKHDSNDSITRNEHLKLAEEYYYLSQYEASNTHSKTALKLSEIAKDSITLAKAYYYIGDSFETTNRDSAYYYYLKAEKAYERNYNKEQIGRMKFNKAYLLFYSGNYIESEIEVSKALVFLKNSNKHRLLYSCYTLLGSCLEKTEDYEESMRYYNLAIEELKILKKESKDTDLVDNYNLASVINLCNLYDNKGEYHRSIQLLEPLLTKEIRQKWPNNYSLIQSNLAFSKMKNGQLDGVDNLLRESLFLSDSLNEKMGSIYTKIHLGEYFLLRKDTARALECMTDAYRLSKTSGSHHEILKTLQLLSEVNVENKVYYKNLYIDVSDSINKQQRLSRNKYARIEYETAKLENENVLLQKKNRNYFIVFSCIVIVLFILLILRYIISKNNELRYIKHQKLANDELYDLLTQQQERINLAKEQEKSFIAKELHDNIMNKLYGARMNLGFLNSKHTDEAVEKRKECILWLQNIENEIRDLSHDLKRNTLSNTGNFVDLVRSLTDDSNSLGLTNFSLKCDEPTHWNQISNVKKVNIYRTIQECFLNVHKHAEANRCWVILEFSTTDGYTITIQDDGKGFDVSSSYSGIGMQNIQERMALIHGKLSINSTIGEGTCIQISF